MALLRRFEMEAALEQARVEAARIAAESTVPPIEAPAAFNDDAARAPMIDLAAFEAELMQVAA
jgi:hypothetical protein